MVQADQLIIPDGSIYMSMYKWGLQGINQEDLGRRLMSEGKTIRQKDWENYWNGYKKYDSRFSRTPLWSRTSEKKISADLLDYPKMPDEFLLFERTDRFVPCSEPSKPCVKWGSVRMSLADAVAWPRSRYLAENLEMTDLIIIDCDGDHGVESDSLSLEECYDQLDLETIAFLSKFRAMTHTLSKNLRPVDLNAGMASHPNGLDPVSFHLTFRTDRVIPTMHFPNAHIDILGNKHNQLRYFKRKTWNQVEPAMLTQEIWKEVIEYAASARSAH